MPKSFERWVTSLSVSSNVPSSSRKAIRSRADILPSLCWRSRRSAPPPSSASWLRRLSSDRCGSISMAVDYSGRGASSIRIVSGDRQGLTVLLHTRAQGRVAVLLAIPINHRGHVIGAALFGIDPEHHLLFHGQFSDDDLLEGKVDDDEFRFRSGGPPGFRAPRGGS